VGKVRNVSSVSETNARNSQASLLSVPCYLNSRTPLGWISQNSGGFLRSIDVRSPLGDLTMISGSNSLVADEDELIEADFWDREVKVTDEEGEGRENARL
jgi:hypothetical protein